MGQKMVAKTKVLLILTDPGGASKQPDVNGARVKIGPDAFLKEKWSGTGRLTLLYSLAVFAFLPLRSGFSTAN